MTYRGKRSPAPSGPRPDARTLAAARLVENLAAALPRVRVHIAEQLVYADGYPSQTPGHDPGRTVRRHDLSGVCHGVVPSSVDPSELVTCGRARPCPDHDTPVALTSVESASDARLRLERVRADLEQQVRLIALTAADALRQCERLLGVRVAPVRCTGGFGREGAVEWGDPSCTRVPERDGGLCSPCWLREYRWRRSQGLPTRDRPAVETHSDGSVTS